MKKTFWLSTFNFRRARAQVNYRLVQVKAHMFCVVSLSSLVIMANAQPSITWQTPTTISGTSDVNTSGAYFGSWAPQDGSANSHPVNGVTFQGFPDLPGFTQGATFDNGYDGFGSPNTSDSYYNTLLQYGRFSNEGLSPATFSWSGMTPGNTYLIQFWVNDGRNIGQSRSETITGGGSTSAPLSFGSDGTGPGQYIIGTFVADSSGAQTLTLTPFSTGPNPDPQINLFQVRDITPGVPPIITGQPTNQHLAQGGNTSFTVSAAGSAPLAYQWRFNGASLPSATTSAVALTGVTTNEAGYYDVIVSNPYGSATSVVATLTVGPGQLNTLWSLAPGVRPYLSTNNTERGLAFDPIPRHLA